jgi:hypothetical protein
MVRGPCLFPNLASDDLEVPRAPACTALAYDSDHGQVGGFYSGRATSMQPRVNTKGKPACSGFLYAPSKNTSKRFGSDSLYCTDGFQGPECHPRSSAVMICTGWLHSARARVCAVGLAPPQTGRLRRRGRSQPHAREYGFISRIAFNHAKIERLLLRKREYFVLRPVRTTSALSA